MKIWFFTLACFVSGIVRAAVPAPTLTTSTTLVAAEYFWNTDPGVGAATALTVPQGLAVDALLNIQTGMLTPGAHFLGFRVRTDTGKWSQTRTSLVYIYAPGSSETPGVITDIEYFMNTDRGLGNNTILPMSPTNGSATVAVSIPLPTTLAVGTYQVGIRTRTGRGQWSQTMLRPLVIFAGQTTNAISRVEYFVDTDPGYGLATNLPFSPAGGQDVTVNVTATSPNTLGLFGFFFRALDTNNRWSALYYQPVNVTLLSCTVQETLKSGNWNDPTVWSCGSVPMATQDVLIKAGHTVTVLSPMGRQVCRNLRFETGGRLANSGILGLSQP